MNFSKEEIALCWKIGIKHRKEIVVGNWIHFEDGFYLVIEVVKTPEKVDIYATDFGVVISADDDFTPLWQISDCLEFMKERRFYIQLEYYGSKWQVKTYKSDLQGYPNYKQSGKTPLKALLKAVLAILREKS